MCLNKSISLILLIINIFIHLFIISSLSHIENLSNCDCSKLPYNKYIRGLLILFIFIDILFFNLFYYSNYKCNEDFVISNSMLFIISFIISFISIFIYVYLYLYLKSLKEHCKCAYGEKEKFIYWYFIIIFSIWISVIILSFISGFVSGILDRLT
jgi:hypothetical protein